MVGRCYKHSIRTNSCECVSVCLPLDSFAKVLLLSHFFFGEHELWKAFWAFKFWYVFYSIKGIVHPRDRLNSGLLSGGTTHTYAHSRSARYSAYNETRRKFMIKVFVWHFRLWRAKSRHQTKPNQVAGIYRLTLAAHKINYFMEIIYTKYVIIFKCWKFECTAHTHTHRNHRNMFIVSNVLLYEAKDFSTLKIIIMIIWANERENSSLKRETALISVGCENSIGNGGS